MDLSAFSFLIPDLLERDFGPDDFRPMPLVSGSKNFGKCLFDIHSPNGSDFNRRPFVILSRRREPNEYLVYVLE